MGDILLKIEVEHRICSGSCSQPFPSGHATTFSASFYRFLDKYCTPSNLASHLEITFVLWAFLITSAYTLHHEKQDIRHPNPATDAFLQTFDPGDSSIISDPSPILMLVCCLVLGTSVSSFIYRRQEFDGLQAPIFILWITAAVVLGLAVGFHANIIMLSLVPFALFCAMLSSCIVHFFVTRYGSQARKFVYSIDEKDILIRKL
ncbi:hypothetical protein B0O99DRAFT_735243 [Bisporella sp. PMI_857]|nr:hypothetical protein B0O99DRAFT_735243 [Bisporella sp. PMI_857]